MTACRVSVFRCFDILEAQCGKPPSLLWSIPSQLSLLISTHFPRKKKKKKKKKKKSTSSSSLSSLSFERREISSRTPADANKTHKKVRNLHLQQTHENEERRKNGNSSSSSSFSRLLARRYTEKSTLARKRKKTKGGKKEKKYFEKF